ncbi:MAG: hypothetical protein U9Q94_06720 [Candidatus Bipolaricaulota bacterium]|nr:hypothetical protein [Candidatus Bipolaricaulota bacterium]
MKKIGILLVLAALAMALIGCGAKETTSSQAPAASTAETETQPATSPPAPETLAPSTTTTPPAEKTTEAPVVQPEAPTPETPAVEVDANATLSKSVQALRSLSSYRYRTVMNYEGTEDGVADSGTLEVLGEYSAPDRYHLTVSDSSEDTRSEFVKIGDALWVYDDGEWTKVPEMAVTAMSESIFSFALDFVWGTLVEGLETGVNFVGKETVNGIKSLHYSGTNSDWEKGVGGGFGNTHGDVWIAEAGYPVKFVFTASGTDEEGNSGSIEWRSDVTDVDSQVTIAPPTEE